MVVKAVLFDFWGTLIENGTYSPMKQSYDIIRARMRFGDFVPKFENILMTKTFSSQTDAFSEVLLAFNTPVKQFIIDKLIGVWNKNMLLAKPFPETIEVLEKLKSKGLKLAIVSNTPSFSADQVLDKFELRKYFDGIFLSYEVGALKTDAKLFDEALSKLSTKKEETVMVGDSLESDIEGAKKAGIRAILIDRADRREYSDKIKTLNELDETL